MITIYYEFLIMRQEKRAQIRSLFFYILFIINVGIINILILLLIFVTKQRVKQSASKNRRFTFVYFSESMCKLHLCKLHECILYKA